MKEYEPKDIRNAVVLGHSGVGKTSLMDAMLFNAGMTNRVGKVDDGSSLLDYAPDEIERKVTINLTLTHMEWNGCKLNLIDTPGYSDFYGDTRAGIRVADAAVVLVRGDGGVEVGTDLNWQQIDENGQPAIVVISRMDKEQADFDAALESFRSRISPQAVAVCIPWGRAENFVGVIDVLAGKAYRYGDKDDGSMTEEAVPEEYAARVEEYRSQIYDRVAESDDALLEKYLETGELSDEDVASGMRGAVIGRTLFPVYCAAGLVNRGVKQVMDGIAQLLPSPVDRGTVVGNKPGTEEKTELEPLPSGPLAAFVFKTVSEPHVGELSLFRVYSGTLGAGTEIYNHTKDASEKTGQIHAVAGKERKEVARVVAGDFGAAVKLKNTATGDTLGEQKFPVLLPEINFPKPVMETAIRAVTKGEEDKIAGGMARLREEDPTFSLTVDAALHQTIIAGLGELHLEVLTKRLKERFGVQVELVKPKIPYRETIKGTARVQGKYKKQTGGRGQYGDVWLKLEPQARGEGYEFVNAIVGGSVPGKFIPAVEKGIAEPLKSGPLANRPVVDLKVILDDGSYHNVDSSENSFKVAGSMAFRKGFLEAQPYLLEPIYRIKVRVPEDYMGDVMGDLSSRRGKIQGMDAEGNFQVVRATVPLAELYRYSTHLRSMTQGRGVHEQEFSHYEELPKELAEKVKEEAQAEREAE
ncbi:MAG: elongation factor G [Candidatus Eisenbacteria sp.]|nr:elongation factor G [Candidatus Eisenbacteria bacterium]